MLISVSGFIGSGKDTIAEYLIKEYNFTRLSFASSLKDAVSAIFGWDRELLEGSTLESRAWREQIDEWWSARLNIPGLTPRYVLQYLGTNVLRRHFHDDIWIASVQRKMQNLTSNVVITDARFPNELSVIKQQQGILLRVKRGAEPDWYDSALRTNKGLSEEMQLRSDVHPSEWAWVGTDFDREIENNSTIVSLYESIDKLIAIYSKK